MSRLSLAVLALTAAVARADVVGVHPGVTLVRHGGAAMTISNLCAPGVSVRATRYAERQATPQQWAQAVGAQVAINADFFDFPGWSWVLVRARGAGEEWPASAEKLEQPSSYWKFGPGVAGFEGNSLVTPGPEVTEVVGAYDWLISGGRIVDFTGQPFMLASYRRSAIGLSADRSHLYFYSSNAAVNGPAMAAEMIAMAAEAGAPPIDLATNEDGGGSAQLYVQGLGQVITSGRQVNTHLGVYATGSGPSPNCPNQPPRGWLDGVSCDGAFGWAQDVDAPTSPIDVHLYFDGPAGSGARGLATRADVRRDDLCQAIGSCEHGFLQGLPLSALDGKPHQLHAYGIDARGGANPELSGSPKTFSCTREPPPGVRRHVVDPASYAAWRFDAFVDVQPVTDAQWAALGDGDDFPPTPELLRVDGEPAVYVLDRGQRRHLVDPASAARWHLDLGAVKVVSAAEATAWPLGPDWPLRPYLVQGSGPAISMVDDGLALPRTRRAWSSGPLTPSRGPRPGRLASRPSFPVFPAEGWADPAGSPPMTPALGGCGSAPGLLAPLALLALRRRRVRAPG